MRVKAPQLVEITGVDRRTITNWLNEERPVPSIGAGRSREFETVDVIAWLVDRAKREEQRNQPNDVDLARGRREAAAARKIEIEVEELEGTRMLVSVHEQRLRERCEELAGRVKGLNHWVLKIRAARTEEEADEIADRMEDDLLKALRGVADEVPDEPGPNGDGDRARAA